MLHCNWASLSGLSFHPPQRFRTSSHPLHPPAPPSTSTAKSFNSHSLGKSKLRGRTWPIFPSLLPAGWTLPSHHPSPILSFHPLPRTPPTQGLGTLLLHQSLLSLFLSMDHSRIFYLQKHSFDLMLPPATAPFFGLPSEPRLRVLYLLSILGLPLHSLPPSSLVSTLPLH